VRFQDALTWLINPPDEALGFILADNGYDVWISNTRGTKYSRSHKSLSPNDAVLLLIMITYMHFDLSQLIGTQMNNCFV